MLKDSYCRLDQEYTYDIWLVSTRIPILKEIEVQAPKFLDHRNEFVNKLKNRSIPHIKIKQW